MGIEAVTSDELDLTCPAELTTPGLVRTLVGFRLAGWGLLHVVHDVLLIVGELTTNAVESTPHQEIRVRFGREAGAVLLAVWDSSDGGLVVTPVVERTLDDVAPDPEALDPGHDDGTGGWGLPIVQALSAACGVHRTPPGGKWVWARCATRRSDISPAQPGGT